MDTVERKTKKEAKLFLRNKVIENASKGGYKQRCLLLAYAFVKGVPYSVLERTINEDKYIPCGRDTFLYGVIWTVSANVCEAYGIAEDNLYSSEEYIAVCQWVYEKYTTKSEVAA
jgi:hypothetical protein